MSVEDAYGTINIMCLPEQTLVITTGYKHLIATSSSFEVKIGKSTTRKQPCTEHLNQSKY